MSSLPAGTSNEPQPPKKGTAKYTQCPFCGARVDGVRIFRCAACGKYFCECRGYAKSVRGWTYCPHCSNMELAEDILIGVIDTGDPSAD